MSEADLRAAAERFEKIRALKERLGTAQHKLSLVNKHAQSGSSWTVELRLTKDDHFNRGITVTANVPVEVVQQQCVNEVSSLRRQIILLGGEP